MPEVRSGEVQVGFFHQPIGRRFEASGHRCWLKSARWLTLVDDRTVHVLDLGSRLPSCKEGKFLARSNTFSTLLSQLDHWINMDISWFVWMNIFYIVEKQFGNRLESMNTQRSLLERLGQYQGTSKFRFASTDASFQISWTSKYRIS